MNEASAPRVLVWTRSHAARDSVALALSRAGIVFRFVSERAELDRAAGELTGALAIILGPSFTTGDARALAQELAAARDPLRLRIVVLEELVAPLACRSLALDSPTQVLTLPVQMRSLVDAVLGPR